MSKIVEEAIPAIRLFFTGLLAMSYEADERQVKVGIQHGVANHYLRITAFERPIESYGWGESRALYTGLPIQLYDSTTDTDTGHWKLEVSGTANQLSTDDILQNAVVLDGEGFHNRSLTSWLNQDVFRWKFSFDKGQVYGATIHSRLKKKIPAAGDLHSEITTPFQAAINFGVNIHLGSNAAAQINDEQNNNNNGLIFRFHPQCRYDVYVGCLPDYSPPAQTAKAAELVPSDFQLHYHAFGLVSNEWFDIEPDLPPQLGDDEKEDVGLNFISPCVPIFLSQTPF